MAKNFLLCLFTAFFFQGVCQTKRTTGELKVQKVITNIFQSLSDRDYDKMKANCTTDFTVLENGIIWNLDTLQQKIILSKAIPDFNRVNTISFTDTRIKGKVAWVTYNNHAAVTRNGKKGTVEWLESAVLVKEGKGWKIQLLHSTVIKRV